jgi:ATP-dependent RNA helicase DeaD
VEISIKDSAATAPNISQYYLLTQGLKDKSLCLARILEMEKFEGILIFVRTKIQTVEIAEQLVDLGYSCGPLNGDIAQSQRLRMVEQLKSGKLDIVVATDVAARGLDVDRISHVINFDVPFDTEAYIHRIGRTGRAGRSGKAILFLAQREKSMLKAIEKATKQKIELLNLPSVAEINCRRIETYKNEITATLTSDCSFFANLVEEYCRENDTPTIAVAAALAKMNQGKTPLVLTKAEEPRRHESQPKSRERYSVKTIERHTPRKQRAEGIPEQGMDRYRIEVGSSHGVKPGNIVGAIANEADLSSEHIGKIAIFDDYSTVDLPYGMPNQTLRLLQKTHILDRKLRIRREVPATGSDQQTSAAPVTDFNRRVRSSVKAPRRKGQIDNRPYSVSITK